jgi:hypothetical protein
MFHVMAPGIERTPEAEIFSQHPSPAIANARREKSMGMP